MKAGIAWSVLKRPARSGGILPSRIDLKARCNPPRRWSDKAKKSERLKPVAQYLINRWYTSRIQMSAPTDKDPSLRQRAYDHLQRKLLSGELVAGSVVSEQSLATEIGMSRTPVPGGDSLAGARGRAGAGAALRNDCATR